MKKDEKYKAPVDKFQIPANPVYDQPLDCIELINKYGTYEIQPTNDSGHDFPKIAQGLPKEENRKVIDKD